MEREEEDPKGTFTEAEVQELASWIESLTLVDIAALKNWWERNSDASERRLQ